MALVRRQNARPQRSQRWDLAAPGLGGLVEDVDRLFGELAGPLYSASQWASGYPVDLYETAEAVVLRMAVPGIRVEDLDIQVEGRQLTIQGSYPEEDADDGRRYWLQTIPHGSFSRTVTLPIGVDLDDAQADVQQGMLTLTLPKAPEARARRIEVRAG